MFYGKVQSSLESTIDAFRAVGYTSVGAVRTAPAADLKQIFQYYVVGSVIDLSAFLTNVNTSYQITLTERRATLYKVSNTDICINKAKIVEGNIPITGSVVHIINQVLTPFTLGATDLIQKKSDLS
ncbi:fasciclin domain-containing protein [Spirosoma jeollabukense]